jgi:hypothetical protein
LVDEDAYDFIDSFQTVTQNIMLVQAQMSDPTLDLSQINLQIPSEVPLIPITTGNIDKDADYHAFILFLGSDAGTVHQIYSFLYSKYFQNRRSEYWIKGI